MPHSDFEKYNPTRSDPWKPENPGTSSKGLGDILFENIRDITGEKNLKKAQDQAGGMNETYFQLLAEQVLSSVGDDLSRVTPALIETVFKMVELSHPPLIKMFHDDQRRDRPVKDRITNAQDQSRVLKETILRMLTDTK